MFIQTTKENIKTVFITGNNLENTLLKKALDFGESGKFLWFISPEPITKLPDDLTPPEKEVLKLLTFLYLKDGVELLKHLNSVHTWHRIPELILINDFDTYISLGSENYNPSQGAFLCALLIEAAIACSKKHNKTTYVIVSCSLDSCKSKDNVQALVDLYFGHLLDTDDANLHTKLNMIT